MRPLLVSAGAAGILIIALGVASYSRHDDTAGPHQWTVGLAEGAERIVLRTVSTSVWPRPMTLVEELRLGGFEGKDVQAIAPDARGGAYVFEAGGSLRYYDSLGAFVRTVGGRGSGPGQYQDVLLGMDVRRDGRLLVRDPRNARLTLFNPDGTFSEEWPVASGLHTAQAMTLDTADHVFLRILVGEVEPGRPWPIGLLHLDPTGRVVDTIPPPILAGEPVLPGRFLFPSKLWAFGPHRALVISVNDRYSFDIRRPGQPTVRVERVWPIVATDPAEWAEYEAVRHWAQQRARQGSVAIEWPSTPHTKPAYRGLAFANDGRIWVRRHTRAVKDTMVPGPARDQPPAVTWQEPPVWDVFEEDGTYLGEVRGAPRVTLMVLDGDRVWGVRLGYDGRSYVARFRIVPADG